MSYFVPNTTIWLLENIPFDKSYHDTVRFPFPQEATPANLQNARNLQFSTYFSRYIKYTFDEQYYQRKERGWLRICKRYEDVYNCNYLVFKNTSYENRYIYAFIDEVVYINQVVTEIHYVIDVIQTWFFDIKWNECFIDRGHAPTDDIGDNIVPEDFGEQMDYDYYDLGTQPAFERVGTVLASTVEFSEQPSATIPSFDNVEGGLRQRIYGGVQYYYFDDYGTNQQYNWLNFCIQLLTRNGKSDALVSMFMYPWELFNQSDASIVNYDDSDPTDNTFIRVLNPSAHISAFGNYVPFNKKLYTYPYVQVIASDENGQTGVYRPEQFKDTNGIKTNCVFKIQSAMSANPEMQIVPLNYEGMDVNFIQKLTTNNFANCPYTIDSYLAWLAQTRVPRILSVVDSIGGIVGAENLTSQAAGVVESADRRKNVREKHIAERHISLAENRGINSAFNIGKTVAETFLNSYKPAIAQGQQTNAMQTAIERVGFRFYRAYLKEMLARRVDDYFTHYGYAIKGFGDPRAYIQSRTNFSYVRTEGCNATGNIPNDDMTEINDIMDNGITFWNYELYNSIKDYPALARSNTPQNLYIPVITA